MDSARVGLESEGDVSEDEVDEMCAQLIDSLADVMGGDRFDDDLWKTEDDEARLKVLADMTMLLAVGHFSIQKRGFWI